MTGGAKDLATWNKALLPVLVLSGLILAGCIVPVPVPVPIPVPAPTGQQGLQAQVTQSQTVREARSPTLTPVDTPTQVAAGTGTPVPAPAPVFRNPLPRGTAYAYPDNMDFHTVSVSVGNCEMRTIFYFTPGSSGSRLTPVEAIPGMKFLMVGVDFHMTGIRKEGKSDIFMTPLATSFRLVKGGDSYGILNASEITGMTDYYIRDVGSMYRDRFIDKDNDGSGVLIFVVPQSFDPAGAYVTFCPMNPPSSGAYYRSPDNWDCEDDLVVWQLR